MSAPALAVEAQPTRRTLATLHVLLAVQSLVVILVSINRLSPLTLGYVLPNEFLRWVDLNNMLILPLISPVPQNIIPRLASEQQRSVGEVIAHAP
ncbi:MAG: hypothetical protein ACRDH2_15605 [Anaerolineales bacterium]